MNEQPPKIESIEEMRKIVEERAAKMMAVVPPPDPEKEKGPDRRFIMDCLRANEMGDGVLFAAIHRDKFVYCHNSMEWLAWDEHSWRRDELNQAAAAVEDVVDKYLEVYAALGAEMAEAARVQDSDQRKLLAAQQKKLLRRVDRLRSEAGRNNCLKFAHTSRDPLAIRGDELDRKPWLMPCANGVIDLKTGELVKGRPKDYLLKRSPIEWKGIDEPCPCFDDFVDVVYDHDSELIAYLQRLFGYGITGLTVEHVFPVFQGRGRNGKGVMVNTLSHVLGELAGPVPSEMLLEGNRGATGGGPTPEIMALQGLRLAFASETDDGRRFSAAKVKWLTGGDRLTGRGLHDKRLSSFDPTHLLLLLTNHKPAAPDNDFAFWERAWIIHHKLSFVDREPRTNYERKRDKFLEEKLRKETSGILAWLVRGCLAWQQRGLDPSEAVTKATEEYQKEENILSGFFEQRCQIDPSHWCPASELYGAFSEWYEKNINQKGMSQKRFGKLMGETELFTKKMSQGKYRYYGIGLRIVDQEVDH